METSGYAQAGERTFLRLLEARRISPPNPLIKPKLEWPFEPRKQKRLKDNEVAEIKRLLAHVRAGNMEISDIANGFSVSEATVRNIRDKKTYVKVRAAKWISPPQKRA